MGTFSSTNIVKKNIATKPYLLTVEELNTIGRNINLVGYDPLRTSATGDEYITLKYDNTSSPRLLNYVEEYVIAGYSKTLFYSEVNTGLKVNDKVFIINGTYDSNLLIKDDKYKKGRDGYTVLFIDKCKIVLDIDFTGYLPANEDTKEINEDIDKFIKVYYVKDRNDFLQVNRQITTRDGNFDYKFNKYQNNIIFTENTYDPIIGWGENAGLTGPGFFVKNGTSNWINITPEFIIGSFSVALSPTYDNSDFKVLILNGTFTYGTQEFKEDSVYKWNGTNWEINIKHENNNPPIITKSNFRSGQFNGIWNGGLFGSNEKRIEWNSDTSTFNSGTLLNTVWKKGIINSIYSQVESYISELSDNSEIAYQKVTNPDNNGYGFNFIINSDIQNSVINNGNLTNTTLGTQSGSYKIVEEHLKGNLDSTAISTNFNNIINKALFDNCRFIDANIENSEIRNSRATNTRFSNIKSVNSHYKSSLIIDSNYISDNIIQILDYDEFEIYDNNLHNSITVYKFYINKRSYDKFKFKDTFYIKGLKINDNSKDIINFFDKKFRIGSWTQYSDKLVTGSFGKIGVEYSAFSSTPKENEYNYKIVSNTNTIEDINSKAGYSIDIFVNTKDTTIYNNPTDEPSFKNIIDFKGAFIINSDFESGVFENSNWNSGHHFNYSNDVNITIPSNEGGLYNIGLTGPSSISYNLGLTGTSLMVSTQYNPDNREVEDDYLSEGSIVFLNDVDYDTSGRVFKLQPEFKRGSYYTTGTYSTTGNVGKGLILGITASIFGSVTGITYSSPQGFGYTYGLTTSTTTGGSGVGLTVEIFGNSASNVETISIVNPGMSYSVGNIIEILGGAIAATFSITTRNQGEILSATIIQEGAGYRTDAGPLEIIVGNESASNGAEFNIMAITGSVTRLPSAYKIESNTGGLLRLNDISLTTTNLAPGGQFITMGANNRYGYLHKAKFTKSKIKSGFFINSFIESSLIKNDSYDVSDKDFNNIEKIKSIVICDTIFSGNYNILSKALYMNSYFVLGGDIWDNGILYNSIWNAMTFNNGLVKESTWLTGIFSNGLFYNSNSTEVSINNGTFNNRIESYYKSGSLPNNRYSWQGGIFLNGEFYKSDWEKGNFNGGKFYNSKFFNGVVNNGTIGDNSVPLENTIVYNGVINYAIVENSTIVSKPYGGGTSSTIQWNNGIFNSGIFGNDGTFSTATWSAGIFNNGQFINNAKWKDGTFNGGKFLSTFGYTNANSTYPIDYSWEKGNFNGGEFGNASGGSNSTWFTGEFYGGRFQGKVWNSGIFTDGEFLGSATFSAIGGLSASNAGEFKDSFDTNYYGLWRNGTVTNIREKVYTNIKRASDTRRINNTAIFKNILWENGLFNHSNGTIQNSIWLDGTFKNGLFGTSSFNPYVRRTSGLQKSFNSSDTCIWEGGRFDGGDFYISKWNNGEFITGNAYGMIWDNGVADYMNAYNIFWNDGVWKNGNWNGSYFNIDNNGGTTDDFTQQILSRGNTASLHIWNIFNRESISLSSFNYDTGKGELISGSPSNTPVTPTLTAVQYIDALGIPRIVLDWQGAYSYYGIESYEILYKTPFSATWFNAYNGTSTLTYGTFTQYTNLNYDTIDFKIRVKDTNGNYSEYSPVTTVQIYIMLKLTTDPIVDYTSYTPDVQYVCLLSGTLQNVYTQYTFNTGSIIYNSFNASVASSPFTGDTTNYRILESITTSDRYVVAIDGSGTILDSVDNSLYNSESFYHCGAPVTYYSHNMSLSGQSTAQLSCQAAPNSTLIYSGSQGLRYTTWLQTSPIFPTYTVDIGTNIVFYARMHANGAIAFDHTYTKNVTLQSTYASVKDWFETEIAVLTEWNAFVAQNFTDALFTTDGSRFKVRPNRNGTATRDIYTDISFTIKDPSNSLILYSTDSTLVVGSILYQDQYTSPFILGSDKYWYSGGYSYKINSSGHVSTINNC